MLKIPTFGLKEETVVYQTRHAAYTTIANDAKTQLLLVQAPNSAFFLPGGEIEEQETKVEAVHREVMEELGFVVTLGDYFGQADDYFYSRNRDTYFYNPAYFFDTLTWESQCSPLETTNKLVWFPIGEAKMKLKRGSHKWAVAQWEKKYK